jgi:hypothetical protein
MPGGQDINVNINIYINIYKRIRKNHPETGLKMAQKAMEILNGAK